MAVVKNWDQAIIKHQHLDVWKIIRQLESPDSLEKAKLDESDSAFLLRCFFELQQKNNTEAVRLLSTFQPKPENAHLILLAQFLSALMGNPIQQEAIQQALRYDKGTFFTLLISGFSTYPGLVDAGFSNTHFLPIILESAYKCSVYPWLHKSTLENTELIPSISGSSNSLLKTVVLYLQERFSETYPLLKSEIQKQPQYWVLHWFLAKTAFELEDFSTVHHECAFILKMKPNFWFARELRQHTSGFFAQLQQDKEAEHFFKSFKPKYKTCVEVGAFDGLHYSNVRRFSIHHGWKSVHFEPVADNFKRLEYSYRNQPHAILINKAVGPNKDEIDLHVSNYADLSEWGSDIASVLDEEKQRWQNYKPDWHIEKVASIRLTDALLQNNIEGIDLLSIDAEGYDLEVLKTLDLNIFKPELIIIEYGSKRQEILDYANESGYSLYEDNGQDLFLTPTETVPSESIKDRLNPKFLEVNHLADYVQLQKIKPAFLINNRRFDIGIKYAYAHHYLNGTLNPFIVDAYKQHLWAFNQFKEGDYSGKNTFEKFKSDFDTLLDTMKEKGFDAQASVIPTDKMGIALDGAHRIAAALALEIPILIANTQKESRFAASAEYFRQKGLSENYLDFGIQQILEKNSTLRFITVFPRAVGHHAELIELIQQHSTVYYAKLVQLSSNGGFNLIRQMYKDEPWLGNAKNGFAGAQHKAKECFRGDTPVRVFVVQPHTAHSLVDLKKEIRSIYNVENHSVHINDTYQESLLLSGCLLNAQSIHFLNHASVQPFSNFYTLIKQFENWLKQNGVRNSQVCIDGSATLSAYGLRDCGDLDFIHEGERAWGTGLPLISSHNIDSQLKYHAWSKDEILFNPERHFYYNGIKFVSLEVLKAMKTNRNEPKDRTDVDLINQKLHPAYELANLSDFSHLPAHKKDGKIIGLVPVKNESAFIKLCLQALSKITDGIILLDDHSEDDTVQIVRSLQKECSILEIIEKDTWHRDEPGDRNLLLQAGRKHGGTHFVVIDADEVFTSNMLDGDLFRKAILNLEPGDKMAFTWIQLWRDTTRFRFDKSVWTWNIKPFVFCDDGTSSYASEFIHTPRFPVPLKGKTLVFKTYEYGLMHFQFVNWHNLLVKQAWYRALEHIREPNKPAKDINERYFPSKDEREIQFQNSPFNWFKNYVSILDLEKIEQKESWRTQQMREWFKEYGTAYFKDLDIWDINWGVPIPAQAFCPDINRFWQEQIEQVKQLVIRHQFSEAITILELFTESEFRTQAHELIQKMNVLQKDENKK